MVPTSYSMANPPLEVIDLKEEDVDQLLYKKGQMIYCEGSTPLGVYFVKNGKVKISITGSDGKEQILRIASPDDILSYADLISGIKYTTSARAIEDSMLLFISKGDFWEFINRNPSTVEKFALLVSRDLLMAEAKIADLAYKPVRGRLADAITALVKKFDAGDGRSNSIAISRKDLACYVGTAKETLNRFLSEFRNDRLIETRNKRIVVLDSEGLNKISRLYF